MASVILLALFVIVGKVSSYNPHHLKQQHDPRITDALLREVMDQMGKDMTDSGSFGGMQFPMGPRMDPEMELPIRALKDLSNEDQMMGDYGPILAQQPPSLRDPEYLQHSSLFSRQFLPGGGASEGKQRVPISSTKSQNQIKPDSILPAYCNPPNPCPIGYSEGCLTEFENSATFSRDYQAAQDCMCDTEHMFDCSMEGSITHALTRDDHRMVQDFLMDDGHKAMVAKKGAVKRDGGNPFLAGEKLPVAAKKGFDVGY